MIWAGEVVCFAGSERCKDHPPDVAVSEWDSCYNEVGIDGMANYDFSF